MQAAPKPDGAPEPAPAKSALPTVESPPLSPGTEIPPTSVDTPAPSIEPIAAAVPAPRPRLVLKARHKRYALLAASVAIAAALGTVAGVLASGGFSAPAHPDVVAIEENMAMQQSIVRLGKEIATLKAGFEQANKSAHSRIAKISERLEHASAEVTGSIAAPPTIAPLPSPRPTPSIAAVENQLPARVPVVAGWTIRDARGGYVYVKNHGDVYQVVPGAPLPGLGPVQSVRRQDGRWIVLTPKGIIVSMQDRRYFESY